MSDAIFMAIRIVKPATATSLAVIEPTGIIAARNDDGTLRILDGNSRLKAMHAADPKAKVTFVPQGFFQA